MDAGEDGHRSRYLLNANQALYHLSYSPMAEAGIPTTEMSYFRRLPNFVDSKYM
jgi:hypothetical protein